MDLIDAVRANDLERVRLLVEQGADKDMRVDNHGRTPLWWASCRGHLEMTKYLVEQGAALDEANNNGTTPLMIAIASNLEVCRYLLEQGADRDKADNYGWTPLHIAAQLGKQEIAMLLMSYGADLNARNKDGRLPIEMGSRNTEEIKQAIRDEPRRRMDEAPGKRATEQDRHPNTTTSVQQEEDEKDEQQSNKRPRLNDAEAVAGVVEAEEGTNVAEEDEDSEPSSDEDDD